MCGVIGHLKIYVIPTICCSDKIAGFYSHVDAMESACCYVEFLPRIGAFQVAVADRGSCRLFFTARRVCRANLDGEGRSEKEICSWFPPVPEINPGSFLDLKLSPGGTLHVRFQSRGRGEELRDVNVMDSLHPPTVCGSSGALVLKCGFCHQTISKPDFSFKRVLPLPSDEWAEFAGDVFCHAHQHTSPHTHHLLTPRDDGDCLTGESVIRVRGGCVSGDKVMIKQSRSGEDNIHCARCFFPLGKVMEIEELAQVDSTVLSSLPLEFDCSRISLVDTSLSPPTSSSLSSPLTGCSVEQLEQQLAKTLHTACKSRAAFKFAVQDKGGHTYLHLWMLNSTSLLTHNTSPSLADMFSGISTPPIHSFRHTHKTWCILKALYQVSMATDHTQWSRDSSVEPLPLSQEECLWLVILLCQSTRAIPPAQRQTNGFSVGFLRTGPC